MAASQMGEDTRYNNVYLRWAKNFCGRPSPLTSVQESSQAHYE